ncbi:uncharacterized protein N7458_000404 [Penicillium daleae]|uniref:Uncharacterized protein n=1 Tax=Penicillium daleae TaxID=63821 RepID=A0AAD6CG28_9EURO|nr:uncharacterized protein N7458_000404 [Penicillium daleae]KAJ5464718.1 hypothetical protein N7458_000404 [Penicillium daleae]
MDSPPKRRRTGEALEVAIGASQPPALSRESRSPSRTSFQSPTRASLARSHPEVLERALSRSPSKQSPSRDSQNKSPQKDDARTVGLRDRKALRPSLNPSSPLKAPRTSGSPMLLSPSKRPSGIQAFSKPPRRLSKRISAADFTFGSPIRKQPQPTEALSNTPEDQLALELGTATQGADMDVDMDTNDLGGGLMEDDDSLEPDLPPTPTQLGLVKAPDRPRGLLSSSPSARHEKRMKRQATDVLQGSPLKTLKFQSPTEEYPDTEFTLGNVSTAFLEKRKTRKDLEAELRALKNDLADLSKWAEKIDSGMNLSSDTKELNKFLNLLVEESAHINEPVPPRAPVSMSALLSTLLPFSATLPRPVPQASPMTTNPFALKETSKAPSYLTVFAPLTLRTNTSRTASKSASLLETHTLTFSAPSPFPPSLYNVSVVYETNPETQTVTSVSVPTGSDSKKRRVPEALRQWIDSRLENPLLALDVATLCWGINRYWEASVARAQLWARIDNNHGTGSAKRTREAVPESQDGIITVSELRRLVPHLERSTMIIKTGSSSNNGPRVLLSNALVMDEWTGEPQLQPELSVSTSGGSSKKIDQETRKLFQALLREQETSDTWVNAAGGVHADAILRATEGAIGALLGNA